MGCVHQGATSSLAPTRSQGRPWSWGADPIPQSVGTRGWGCDATTGRPDKLWYGMQQALGPPSAKSGPPADPWTNILTSLQIPQNHVVGRSPVSNRRSTPMSRAASQAWATQGTASIIVSPHKGTARTASQLNYTTEHLQKIRILKITDMNMHCCRWKCGTTSWTGRATSSSATCSACPRSRPGSASPSLRCRTGRSPSLEPAMSVLWSSWAKMPRRWVRQGHSRNPLRKNNNARNHVAATEEDMMIGHRQAKRGGCSGSPSCTAPAFIPSRLMHAVTNTYAPGMAWPANARKPHTVQFRSSKSSPS